MGIRSSGQCINGSTVESKQTIEVQDLLTLWGQEVVVNVSNGSTVESKQTTEVQDLLTFWGQEVVVNISMVLQQNLNLQWSMYQMVLQQNQNLNRDRYLQWSMYQMVLQQNQNLNRDRYLYQMYHTCKNWFYSRIRIDNRSAGLSDLSHFYQMVLQQNQNRQQRCSTY